MIMNMFFKKNQLKAPFKANEDIKKGLLISKENLRPILIDKKLLKDFWIDWNDSSLISSQKIFSFEEQMLPCWLESDYDSRDDWIVSPLYYPVYFNVFKRIAERKKQVRFLEVGVRTGYTAVVFVKSVSCESFYLGVDPNLYLKNGLELANASLRKLKDKNRNFNYVLINGYSWDRNTQREILKNGPYDIIHIDGDHTLVGKLNDLWLARNAIAESGIVLIDDFIHHECVSDAIRRVLSLDWFKKFALIVTDRGLAVMTK